MLSTSIGLLSAVGTEIAVVQQLVLEPTPNGYAVYGVGCFILPQILQTGGSTLQSHLWLPVSDSGHFQAPETKYSFSRDAIDFLFSPPLEKAMTTTPFCV
jgi:hypothetical protein